MFVKGKELLGNILKHLDMMHKTTLLYLITVSFMCITDMYCRVLHCHHRDIACIFLNNFTVQRILRKVPL